MLKILGLPNLKILKKTEIIKKRHKGHQICVNSFLVTSIIILKNFENYKRLYNIKKKKVFSF